MPRMARRGAGRGAARRTVRRVDQRQRRRRRRRRRRVLIGGMMVVGTGAMAYKLGSKQKQQIEQASGMPVEEMTDEEITQVVKENNIQVEGLSDSDKASVEAAGPIEEYEDDEDVEYEDEEPQAAGGDDYTAELEKLADLRDKGILTDEEFAAKKKQILGL